MTRPIVSKGSITISCEWPLLTLDRDVRVCLNLGNGTASTSYIPRYLSNGSNKISFNLHKDAAYSQVWGSVSQGASGSPFSLKLTRTHNSRTATTTLDYYGRIDAGQYETPLVNGTTTTYQTTFSGGHTAMNHRFFGLIDRDCAVMQSGTERFPFNARVDVVNDCTIRAENMNFPSTGLFTKPVKSSSQLHVRCTNGGSWQMSLNGGNTGNVLDRQMKQAGGGAVIKYQLYTSSARNVIWGNGLSGTGTVTGLGSGQEQAVSVYGTVPVQSNPRPGDYRDTIIATVTF